MKMKHVNLVKHTSDSLREKVPSEMDVALPHKLLTLLPPFTERLRVIWLNMTIFIWASLQKRGLGNRRTGLDTLQTAMTTRALVVLRMNDSAIF